MTIPKTKWVEISLINLRLVSLEGTQIFFLYTDGLMLIIEFQTHKLAKSNYLDWTFLTGSFVDDEDETFTSVNFSDLVNVAWRKI